MFGTILISVCTVMHVYVFWRTSSVPFIKKYIPRKTLIGAGVVLWAVFFFGRVIGHAKTGILAAVLEFLGMSWLGVLFLTSLPLLVIDLITFWGVLMPRRSSKLRGVALLIGMLLSVIAAVQGLRPPVVEKYEVSLSGLPDFLDGITLMAVSDMHLGSQLGNAWLKARIAQIKAQQPDIVVLLGDIFEGHGLPEKQLIESFKQLSAPYGIWAVPGNHEYYGGNKSNLFEASGITLLTNEWTQVKKGLIIAGVEDLTIRRRHQQESDPVSQALAGRPPGATILLSHTPWQAKKAAMAGVGLMLSGHTHGGQIWPFGYIVRKRYPLFDGRYEVNGMTVIICRGTGTWGPRMRLWLPGQILRITLRKKRTFS